MATIILTAYGSDRPGLVQKIADAVHKCGGNWLESHLSRLAGMFVGSVLVDIPDDKLGTLKDMLRGTGDKGLTVMVVPADAPVAAPAGTPMILDIIGTDRPGIIREVTGVLADQGINILEIDTEIANSPWSGDMMFKARAELEIPAGLDLDRLQSALERLSGEIMVDVALKQAE